MFRSQVWHEENSRDKKFFPKSITNCFTFAQFTWKKKKNSHRGTVKTGAPFFRGRETHTPSVCTCLEIPLQIKPKSANTLEETLQVTGEAARTSGPSVWVGRASSARHFQVKRAAVGGSPESRGTAVEDAEAALSLIEINQEMMCQERRARPAWETALSSSELWWRGPDGRIMAVMRLDKSRRWCVPRSQHTSAFNLHLWSCPIPLLHSLFFPSLFDTGEDSSCSYGTRKRGGEEKMFFS